VKSNYRRTVGKIVPPIERDRVLEAGSVLAVGVAETIMAEIESGSKKTNLPAHPKLELVMGRNSRGEFSDLRTADFSGFCAGVGPSFPQRLRSRADMGP